MAYPLCHDCADNINTYAARRKKLVKGRGLLINQSKAVLAFLPGTVLTSLQGLRVAGYYCSSRQLGTSYWKFNQAELVIRCHVVQRLTLALELCLIDPDARDSHSYLSLRGARLLIKPRQQMGIDQLDHCFLTGQYSSSCQSPRKKGRCLSIFLHTTTPPFPYGSTLIYFDVHQQTMLMRPNDRVSGFWCSQISFSRVPRTHLVERRLPLSLRV